MALGLLSAGHWFSSVAYSVFSDDHVFSDDVVKDDHVLSDDGVKYDHGPPQKNDEQTTLKAPKMASSDLNALECKKNNQINVFLSDMWAIKLHVDEIALFFYP